MKWKKPLFQKGKKDVSICMLGKNYRWKFTFQLHLYDGWLGNSVYISDEEG